MPDDRPQHSPLSPLTTQPACFVGATTIDTTHGRMSISDLARITTHRDRKALEFDDHVARLGELATEKLAEFDAAVADRHATITTETAAHLAAFDIYAARRQVAVPAGQPTDALQTELASERAALIAELADKDTALGLELEISAASQRALLVTENQAAVTRTREVYDAKLAEYLPLAKVRDPSTGEQVQRVIVRAWEARTATSLVDVTIDTIVYDAGGGEVGNAAIVVRCTPEHQFITASGDVAASELVGTSIYRVNEAGEFGEFEVVSVEVVELDDPVAVFDLEVEELHNYCVSTGTGCCAAVVHNSNHIAKPGGLGIPRLFAKAEQPEYAVRQVTDPATGEVFEFTAPVTWSDRAVMVLATKYARKTGVPADARPWEHRLNQRIGYTPAGGETHARQLFSRLAGAWAHWGLKLGYFDGANAELFRDEIRAMLEQQVAAPNSPQWFNTGLNWAYGITGEAQGHYAADFPTGDEPRDRLCSKGVVACTDAYSRPQAHACFIQGVEDKLVGPGGIMDLVHREATLFKFGSGSGTNFSRIRGKGEPLSGGGSSSGLLSFLKISDVSAGAIKSGGTTRRSAKMLVVNDDHPDVGDFIDWKPREEAKIRALRAGGVGDPGSFEDEATNTVSGQNGNNSVRVTDKFMRAVAADGDHDLHWRTSGEVARTVKARDLWQQIGQAAWECGAPGIHFADTINGWHTCKADGEIEASNPCQPAHATVLTPEGIRTFADIGVGSTIWSGKQWTTVTRKIATGVKPVAIYHTRAGRFVGTSEHEVFSKGARVQVGEAEAVDTTQGPTAAPTALDPQDIMDGIYLGDGFRRHDTPMNLLCVGEKDYEDYRASEVNPLLLDAQPGYSKQAWEVKTTIHTLPHTYEREVPARFASGCARKVRGFLRGLYTANGSVVVDTRVVLKASSFAVITAVQDMLSAIGIRSYYTVNKSKVVKFSNGDYRCKQSYDLNITTDRSKFRDLIGFLHTHKSEALDRACARPKGSRGPKACYEIVEVEPLGDQPVFDITVAAEEHSYWTGGLRVSNCSEYLFLNDTACNLASLNLVKFVDEAGEFDVESFRHAARLWTIVLDISVSMAGYPSKAIAEQSMQYRTLGLGYANLGGMLMRAGIPYDSDDGRAYCSRVTSLLGSFAWQTSAELAKHLGPFPAFARNRKSVLEVLSGHLQESLERGGNGNWVGVMSDAHDYGVRNAQCTLLAPTGTISLVMDCDTTGGEPAYALLSTKTLAGGGTIPITCPAAEVYLARGEDLNAVLQARKEARVLAQIEANKELRVSTFALKDANAFYRRRCAEIEAQLLSQRIPALACANDISWQGHLGMMAAAQPFLDGAISKTVNLPNTATPQDILDAYTWAWEHGVKAVAIYRDGSKATQVLTTGDSSKDSSAPPEQPASKPGEAQVSAMLRNFQRLENMSASEGSRALDDSPVLLRGQRKEPPNPCPTMRYKLKIAGDTHYMHVGRYEDGSICEVFVDTGKAGRTTQGYAKAFSIVLSRYLQIEGELSPIIGKLRHTSFEPAGFVAGAPLGIKTASSPVDGLAQLLEALTAEDEPTPPLAVETSQQPAERPETHDRSWSRNTGAICSRCGSTDMQPSGTCATCNACGATTGCG